MRGTSGACCQAEAGMHGGRWHGAWALGARTACPCYVPDVHNTRRQVLVCARSTPGGKHRSWQLMAFGNERRSAVQVAPQGAMRMGRSLVHVGCHRKLRATSGGDIARGNRTSFGNGTTKRRASSAARRHAHGADLGTCQMPCGYCGLCPASLVAIDGFWQRTAEPQASSATWCNAQAAKLSKCRMPSVVAGNIGRRHREATSLVAAARHLATGRRSIVQVAPQGAMRMGLTSEHAKCPAVIVGCVRHRSWRLMAFGNERRSAVQAAPQGAVRMGLSSVSAGRHRLLRATTGGDIARGD